VDYLANKLKLDPNLLRDRYEREQRPNLSNEPRHDLTLKLLFILPVERLGAKARTFSESFLNC